LLETIHNVLHYSGTYLLRVCVWSFEIMTIQKLRLCILESRLHMSLFTDMFNTMHTDSSGSRALAHTCLSPEGKAYSGT